MVAMVRMTVFAMVHPEKQGEFLNTMRSLQKDRLLRRGIKTSKIKWSKETNFFAMVDEWEGAEDLQVYLSNEDFRFLIGALKTLCIDGEIRYSPFSKRGGLDAQIP
jgi:quinol monooxygenase YgiN